MKCKGCGRKIDESRDFIKCSHCGAAWHLPCYRLYQGRKHVNSYTKSLLTSKAL